MSGETRAEAADGAESLPALERRIGIPLLGLVAFLVLLAAGESAHALLQMRAMGGELARASAAEFLDRTLAVSAAALGTGLLVSAVLLRQILATLRRGIERRERSEAELRGSEARLRAILDASIDPIVTIGSDGVIRSASRAVGRVFGWEPDELVGRNVSVLMPEPYRSRHDGYLARYLEHGESSVLGRLRELEAVRRDGTVFPCEIWVNPVGVPQGDAPLFCGVLRDITERKRSERRLQQYASHLEVANLELADSSKALQDVVEQLRRSNEDLDEFAYVASHDLKEPLRGIHNTARFLLEDHAHALDAEGVARLETLSRLAERLTAMIDALLEFARLGRAKLAVTKTDLQAVVDDVAESLDVMLREHGVELRMPERLPEVVCSGALVAEVFRNLIENAVKYNEKPERWVEIGVAREREAPGGGGPPVFYVCDNGIGIRERHLESVFRIFRRLNPRDRFPGGTGMGLTIVKKIVERHGGRVWAESAPGEGSTFFFTLGREG